jgi:hypothetical protein
VGFNEALLRARVQERRYAVGAFLLGTGFAFQLIGYAWAFSGVVDDRLRRRHRSCRDLWLF